METVESRLVTLEERVAFAEIARDNAVAMRDEALTLAREKTRRAGEEIAKMRRERNEAKDQLRSVCEALERVLAEHDGADKEEARKALKIAQACLEK